jgi:UDP-glucose 4-epimerase
MNAPERELAVNVRGTADLLGRLGTRLAGRRFLFASSIAAVDRKRKPRRPLTTDDPPAPRSAYAKSKLRCERLLAEEGAARGFAATSLRLATIYGPGQEGGGVVTLARAAREGGLAARLPWPGKISFCHVDDVAEVFWRLASREAPAPGPWFVAEDRGYTMAEAAGILRRVQGGGKGTIGLLSPLLRLAGFGLWLPGVRRFAPWSLRAALSDTILCDSGPIRSLLDLRWTSLPDGLERTFG